MYNKYFRHTDGVWAREDDVFLERELRQVEKKVLETDYRALEFANGSILPITNELPAGTRFYSYSIRNKLGLAKIIANPADDSPRVDIDYKEVAGRVHNAGASFGYSRRDLRSARIAKRSLDADKAQSAKEAQMTLFNQIIPFGDSTYNIIGLFNNPNITEYAVSTVGTGTPNTLWLEGAVAVKTPDQIIADVCGFINSIKQNSKKTQLVNRLLLPLTHLDHISCARIPDTNITILQYLKGIFPRVDFRGLTELQEAELTENDIKGPDGVSALTGSMMVAMNVNERNVKVHEPMPFTIHPAQMKGLEIVKETEHEIGGTDVRKPLGFSYGKNI